MMEPLDAHADPAQIQYRIQIAAYLSNHEPRYRCPPALSTSINNVGHQQCRCQKMGRFRRFDLGLHN